MAIIWQGAVASNAPGGNSVTAAIDPSTGAISQISASGPITFMPADGYASVNGSFSSSVAFPPGGFPANVAAAWTAAAAELLLLSPFKSYTMTITEN